MIVYIFRENLVIVVKDKLDVKPDKTIAFLLKTRTYIEYSGDQSFIIMMIEIFGHFL